MEKSGPLSSVGRPACPVTLIGPFRFFFKFGHVAGNQPCPLHCPKVQAKYLQKLVGVIFFVSSEEISTDRPSFLADTSVVHAQRSCNHVVIKFSGG